MSDCAFCKIADDVPKWALDHGNVVSFKPYGAATPMHRLFIPKEHLVDATNSPIMTGECFRVAAAWAAGKKQPFNLVVNSGAGAGQSVFHLHIHYVPRTVGDGLGYRWRKDAAAAEQQLVHDELTVAMRKSIALGLVSEERHGLLDEDTTGWLASWLIGEGWVQR